MLGFRRKTDLNELCNWVGDRWCREVLKLLGNGYTTRYTVKAEDGLITLRMFFERELSDGRLLVRQFKIAFNPTENPKANYDREEILKQALVFFSSHIPTNP